MNMTNVQVRNMKKSVMSLVEERKGDQAIDVTVSALTEEKGNGVVVVSKEGIGNYGAGQAQCSCCEEVEELKTKLESEGEAVAF
ncbi:hypothetical protein V6N13_108597 [Hibiscus sabdariffa]|uniref:Uncharacterized protein n=1 Tax=Hibiscus sabdariffa TaxID=183260 RepID=A0ABR2STM4_9ROSI